MYHNRRNQIHNIMMDYPLMGEETDAYVGKEEEKEVSGGSFGKADSRNPKAK